MRRMFWTVSLTTLFASAGLIFLALTWIGKNQEAELATLSERSASALDMQFNIWETAVRDLAASHSLVREFDPQILRWEAKEITKHIEGWLALMPVDDLSVHLFNTNTEKTGSVRTSGPTPELVRAVQESRASGEVAVSDVFIGKVSKTAIVAIVQVARTSTGDEYAVVLTIDAQVLSDSLAKAQLHDGEIITLTDGSDRIIARSSLIKEFLFSKIPQWWLDLAKNAPVPATIVAKGPALPGAGATNFLFAQHRLQIAPTWSVFVGRPAPTLSMSSYAIIFPVWGSLLVFGLTLAMESSRIATRRRELRTAVQNWSTVAAG